MPAFADDVSHIEDVIGSVPVGSAVALVTKRLLDVFTSGQIEPGSRLPPERNLAATLGIGRSAVREALAALEILGIVEVRPGSGTYLRGSASELLPETLSWGLMLNASRTRELIELRGDLEIVAARRAAERATDADLAALEKHVETMRASTSNRSRFVEADLKFHLQIARAANNKVLLDLLQSLRAMLRIWVDRALREPEEYRAALEEHAHVLDAIRSRDPEAAATAMSAHMTTAGQRLEHSLNPPAAPS
ncbi:FadR/GntR family transcriptional regulator [Desertivibrio insolitus]|uniref:FadR/GntR family transcriptional regulator n=1 Tax=Herbiconiux sp. SYSU D00978 TaxID=2812562 RepID=UPI001A96DD1F|nr:FadR/GntR family transcriptional regulator [Herbiconiux sp. SYSU D00978]